MRGFIYAPLVGILLLGVALIVSGYTFSAEKNLSQVISSKVERISYVGYVSVAPMDIRSSFIARLRSYLLDRLSYTRAGDAYQDIVENLGTWFTNVLKDISRTYPGNVTIEPRGSFEGTVRSLADNLLLVNISGDPVEVRVGGPTGDVTLSLDVNSSFPIYYPLQEIKKVSELARQEIGLDLSDLKFDEPNETLEEIRQAILEEVLKKADKELPGCSISLTLTTEDGQVFELARDENGVPVIEQGERFPKKVSPSLSVDCPWEVPGLGVKKRVTLNVDLNDVSLYEENLLTCCGHGFPVGEIDDDASLVVLSVLKNYCGCRRHIGEEKRLRCSVHGRKRDNCMVLCNFMGYGCE